MAYFVSQMRKDSNMTYMSTVSASTTTITSPNIFGGNETFEDFALASTFSPNNVYYLRFRIHKIPQFFFSGSKTAVQLSSYENADQLGLQILLKNQNEDEGQNPPEIIGTCSVPVADRKSEKQYSSYAFVFSPTKTFDRLGFRINRVSYDAIYASSKPRNWLTRIEKIRDYNPADTVSGSTVSGFRYTSVNSTATIKTEGNRIDCGNNEFADLCILNNLVTQSQASRWLKIGYQSRPGSLIVVNGEPIRVGRSGIYQINNGTEITSFMVASPGGSNNSKIDAFLLDYAYKTN